MRPDAGNQILCPLLLILLCCLSPSPAPPSLSPLCFQVEATSKKEKAKQRPLALNTVEMLRVASSSLGTRECP